MNRIVRPLILSLLTALLFVANAASSAPTGDASTARQITVSGTGHISAAPDIAMIDVGVVSEAASAAKALQANNQAMTRLMQTLRDQRIAEKDIQTVTFNVAPHYRRERESTLLAGYRVTNQLRVTLRQLDARSPSITWP